MPTLSVGSSLGLWLRHSACRAALRAAASAACASAFCLAGCAAPSDGDDEGAVATSSDELRGANSGYFALRAADARAPAGTKFIAYRLSRTTTRCANGSKATNLCPVNRIDAAALALPRASLTDIDRNPGDFSFLNPSYIFRGSLEMDGLEPVLRASEVWKGVLADTDVRGGDFYLVQSTTAACAVAPCEPVERTRLNYAVKGAFDGLAFDGFTSSDEKRSRDALPTESHVIVYGLDPAPSGPKLLHVAQAFIRIDLASSAPAVGADAGPSR